MAQRICKRLRFSTKETTRIAWLVEQHMRVARAPEMRASKLKRFVREEGFDELLELCRLDSLASHGNLDTVRWVEEYLAQLQPEDISPERLLTGEDLIALGFKPGPVFTEILGAVEDAQLEGVLKDRSEAQRFVLATWHAPGSEGR